MELRDYVRILRAHWIGVVLITVLGVAVAAGWTALQPRVYTATASGYVTATGIGPDTGSSLVGDQLARSKVTSYIDVGSWRSVAEHAIAELGLDATPEAVVSRVVVSNPLDTVVIHVAASAGTPEEARDLAQAWIRGMVVTIDEIEGNGSAGSAAVTLIPGDSARLPSSPSFPNTRLALVLGGLIGLALGVGYAVVRHVFDRRVRDPLAVERESGVAVIGALPLDKELKAGGRRVVDISLTHAGQSALAEPLRELRTNLQFMNVDNPPRAITITSPLPGDGKSTVAANLAMTLSQAGQPVILIDGDLRRPTVATTFGLPDGAGLTDVLAGRVEVTDIAHTVGAGRKLVVITAGRIPPNPSELVGSKRMRDLVAGLSEHALVIVDAPPLLPVTDGAVLANATDGAIIVVTAGKTTYDMLGRALANLDKAHARALGIVLNAVPRKRGGYYGYQYTGSYTAAE